jgi:hypothetical protein
MTSTVLLRLSRVDQEEHRYKTDDDRLLATLYFDVVGANGTYATNGPAVVRSTPGGSTLDILEAQWPKGYAGPRLKYDSYRSCVEQMYRRVVGIGGQGVVSLPASATNVTVAHNRFDLAGIECRVEVAEQSGGW